MVFRKVTSSAVRPASARAISRAWSSVMAALPPVDWEEVPEEFALSAEAPPSVAWAGWDWPSLLSMITPVTASMSYA